MTQICCIAIANTGFKTGQPSFFLSPKQGNKEYIGQILAQYLPLPPPSRPWGRGCPPLPQGIMQNELHVVIPDLSYVNMFE